MDESRWIDDDAGPIVRPYALTGGRTQPATGGFDLIAVVVANRPASPADAGLGSTYAEIMRLCQQPHSVAEIAAHLRLPTGITRVLLGDLVEKELIRKPTSTASLPTDDIFRAVIDGIRAL